MWLRLLLDTIETRQGDGDAFLVEGVAFGVEGDALEQGSDAFEQEGVAMGGGAAFVVYGMGTLITFGLQRVACNSFYTSIHRDGRIDRHRGS